MNSFDNKTTFNVQVFDVRLHAARNRECPFTLCRRTRSINDLRESTSLIGVNVFQTSADRQTENAHLPNWLLLRSMPETTLTYQIYAVLRA